MTTVDSLPLPVLDALPLGAHRVMALTDEGLYRANGVRIAYYSREGGVSSGIFASLNCGPSDGDNPQSVTRNLRIACESAGAEYLSLAMPKQVHGTRLIEVLEHLDAAKAQSVAEQEADGVLVGNAGQPAMLISADCPLVAVVSPSGRFAFVHAGWRGAVAGIAGKAARMLGMRDEHPPATYNAYIGPHICAECFEVGDDVVRRFANEFGESCVSDGRHVDLGRAISADLVRNGLHEEHVIDARECTKCNPDRYFSYRATKGECGRQGALVFCRKGHSSGESPH